MLFFTFKHWTPVFGQRLRSFRVLKNLFLLNWSLNMDRVWILLVMFFGISLAHMCDGWRDAPDASIHAVSEQLRTRSLSQAPLDPGPIRYHTLEDSPRSDTDTGPAAHALLQEKDNGKAREKAERIPRQTGRSGASHRARSISKARTPERADSKPAHPKRLTG